MGIKIEYFCIYLGFFYERDFMLFLTDNNQTDLIETFNSTSKKLVDLLYINNPYCQQIVGQIYPNELHFNKANSFETETESSF